MGAVQSNEPRSVSLDNPSPAGVIDLADEVVDRLKKGIVKQARENAHAAKASEASVPPPKKPEVQTPRIVPTKPSSPKLPTKAAHRETQSVSGYVAPSGHTITAVDVMRQKEVELHENDVYWRQRLTDLERSLKKTNEEMEKEFDVAVSNVKKSFASAPQVHQLPPCQDLKAKVVACYRVNPSTSLNCSKEVTEFRICIDLHRINQLGTDLGSQKPTPGDAPQTAKAA